MERLKKTILQVGQIGKNPDGSITRISFTPSYFEAANATKRLMEDAGMCATIDRVGNVHGILKGTDPNQKIIAIGSHLDTVKEGGIFDGCAGVMAGIECVNRLRECGISMRYTLEVIGFVGEEAHPLFGGLFGSSAMMGINNEMDPASLKKGMDLYGLTEEDVAAAAVNTQDYRCYLELHVEQGDELVRKEKRIGIVEGIVGIFRYRICATGQSNHAGTTKMAARKDALVGISKLIAQINQYAKNSPDDMVATVGKLDVLPGSINIIPGYCEAVLEVRSMEPSVARKFVQKVQEFSKTIEDASIDICPISSKEGVWCDPGIMQDIESVCCAQKVPYMKLTSGAGHDAKAVATRMPIAMIFVPSVGGISHNKLEFTKWEDLALGAEILLQTLLKLDEGTIIT